MKKVLVVSFDCFNSSSSNGRSLGSLLQLTEDLIIYQIYIKNGKPDFIKGDYCFIDENKLPKKLFNTNKCCHFFSFNQNSEHNLEFLDRNCVVKRSFKRKKTPFKMFCRNMVWKLSSISLKKIYSWSLNIKPDYVLIQAGDLPFLFDFGRKIAKKCKSKIVFYCTENYPFKKRNYTNLKKKSLIYPFLRRKLFRATKHVVENAESLIFLTSSLEQEYKKNYDITGKTYVIYPCSDIAPMPPAPLNDCIIFSYCGNLGLGRHKTLIEIAKILSEKYKNSKFIICGNGNNKEITEIKEIENVNYLGTVSYETVLEIYNISNYIFHVESFDKLIANDSVHAFSGKIADCISTGRPFIFVGPDNLCEYQFLNDTGGALTFNSLDLFRNKVFSGFLESHFFDLKKQICIKDKYFSKQRTKHTIEEIFGV